MAAAGLGVYFSSREVGECLHRLAGDETVQKRDGERAAGANGDNTPENRPNESTTESLSRQERRAPTGSVTSGSCFNGNNLIKITFAKCDKTITTIVIICININILVGKI